jgi:hypothetical protein
MKNKITTARNRAFPCSAAEVPIRDVRPCLTDCDLQPSILDPLRYRYSWNLPNVKRIYPAVGNRVYNTLLFSLRVCRHAALHTFLHTFLWNVSSRCMASPIITVQAMRATVSLATRKQRTGTLKSINNKILNHARERVYRSHMFGRGTYIIPRTRKSLQLLHVTRVTEGYGVDFAVIRFPLRIPPYQTHDLTNPDLPRIIANQFILAQTAGRCALYRGL